MDVICEMSDRELHYPLKSSSYVRKVIKNQIPLSMNRKELENLYKNAREYACKSIVDSLKYFENMEAEKIYHIYCKSDHFYILARVRTNYEKETIEETAKRELYEETGATDYLMEPVCVYSVTGKNRVNETGKETFGKLFYADIAKFEHELHSEIEKIEFFENLPEKWTYPDIQPFLIKEFLRRENGL